SAATMGRRMASEEKPYRLYRGGRVRGKVPSLEPKRTGPSWPRIRLRPNRRRRKLGPASLPLFLIFVIVCALGSHFHVRDGTAAANKRLDPRVRQALDDQHGDSTNVLLLGTDHAQLSGRETANRSDSITLVRVDTDKHRIAYLSIPRDLVADIPGYGES